MLRHRTRQLRLQRRKRLKQIRLQQITSSQITRAVIEALTGESMRRFKRRDVGRRKSLERALLRKEKEICRGDVG